MFGLIFLVCYVRLFGNLADTFPSPSQAFYASKWNHFGSHCLKRIAIMKSLIAGPVLWSEIFIRLTPMVYIFNQSFFYFFYYYCINGVSGQNIYHYDWIFANSYCVSILCKFTMNHPCLTIFFETSSILLLECFLMFFLAF